ncbi:hypothetical protein NNJEOMEG_01424 [Fundidesulfovibrio magnetotacticus]|uniref:Cytochrome b5 heme-binding domain-containing protein n=2 Tax=Fundidesulfovibrio magnetotacticus TaxID=2730080 RepID=A0A6V8LRJ1_9BACT|nr:hypothetical protein NNJEOMEG_01424 [Fundidesulfovibrio magnetotacticus]
MYTQMPTNDAAARRKETRMAETKTFTLEELARFDGKEGRPAYVAQGGKVYDITASKLWKAGRHMNRHDAGADLSAELPHAPHGNDRLERYPLVGVVAPECAVPHAQDRDAELPWLLRKSPFLRRHPHPMTVHFPIGFATGAVFFLVLFKLFGGAFLESGVHAMNLAGAVFTPVALATGLATWKYNYGCTLVRPVRIKLYLSPVLWVQFVACAVWFGFDPAALSTGSGLALLTFSMLPVMGVLGFIGATLTFPLHD